VSRSDPTDEYDDHFVLINKHCSFFKLVCRGREKELEDVLQYALFTRVLQDGGWVMVTIARYSSVPPHCKYSFFSEM
jgi:hypothetical protein